MSLETQIGLMTVPQEFARLCNAVLRARYGEDFLPIDDDRPDAGNDGYLKSERRMFAMHCFKRPQNQGIEQMIRRKMAGDLGKAVALKRAGAWDVRAWTFISNYPIPESIATDIVRIGEDAGVEVSWLGPAELAAELQAHPHVRTRFPALQVNEVSEQLGQLHEHVTKLARDLAPAPVEFSGVPRTPEELAQLIATKPPAWEYLLFAGALLQGQQALEFSYLDHTMGIADRREEVGFQATIDVFGDVFERVGSAIEPFDRAFARDVQERAFGCPGEPGDATAIQHLAQVVTSRYAEALSAAEALRRIEPPRLLVRAHELALRQVSRLVETLRDFILHTVAEMDKLPEYLASDEPVSIALDLDLSPDEEASREFRAELRRVGRKVAWRRWIGADLDAH